jgi:hypothetical protein
MNAAGDTEVSPAAELYKLKKRAADEVLPGH